MLNFFTPEKDRQLGSQLRREALNVRREPVRLQARIALSVRQAETSSPHAHTHGAFPTQTIFYAVAAVLCIALALPAVWDRLTPDLRVQPSKPAALVMIDSVPAKEEDQVRAEPVEPATPPLPEVTKDDLALLTDDVQAAVDTLLATLPVNIDLDSLVP